jgi:hypothetical protein
MKTLIALLAILMLSLATMAQVSEGRTTINKADQPAVLGDFNFSPDVVEYVLLDDLKSLGFGKGSESKGFRQYTGIVFNQLSYDKIDLYLKVEKNRHDKTRSTVTMLVSKDNAFVSGSNYPGIIRGATDYLNNLMPKFAERKHSLDVGDQQESVNKAEKKYNSLISKGESLLTKKRSIEDEISQNQKDQDEQKKLLDKERDILRSMQEQNK